MVDVSPAGQIGTGTKQLSMEGFMLPPQIANFALLREDALIRQAALDDELHLLCTEPTVLFHAVKLRLASRPLRVCDKNKRAHIIIPPAHISLAVFDVIHDAVKNAAVWEYICCLLELADSTPGYSIRAPIVQELSKTCLSEYSRSRNRFKSHLSTHTGKQWFERRRPSSTTHPWYSQVVVIPSAEVQVPSDDQPQLHYMLRLCSPDMNPSKAVELISKLDHIHRYTHLEERQRLSEGEVDSLGHLWLIADLCHALSTTTPITQPKKGMLFVNELNEMTRELEGLAPDLDLKQLAAPSTKLLSSENASAVMQKIDSFVMEKAGDGLGRIYQTMVEDYVSHVLEKVYEARQSHSGGGQVQTQLPSNLKEYQDWQQPESLAIQASSQDNGISAHELSSDQLVEGNPSNGKSKNEKYGSDQHKSNCKGRKATEDSMTEQHLDKKKFKVVGLLGGSDLGGALPGGISQDIALRGPKETDHCFLSECVEASPTTNETPDGDHVQKAKKLTEALSEILQPGDDGRQHSIEFELQTTDEASEPDVDVKPPRREDSSPDVTYLSVYEIVAEVRKASVHTTTVSPPAEPFKVGSPTFVMFMQLFSEPTSDLSVSWIELIEGLSDLGFYTRSDLKPAHASVYWYFPPPNMKIQTPLLLHRPYNDEILRGPARLKVIRQMERVYGWTVKSFVVA
ncbi:hypothetical protein F5Y15DRAFT_385851 [Xylariaceae sp. FL0016]|nr:hypothetical protein F5Y15DRAFT_385851 [Xylariaceae sp. FL0016]